MKTTRRQELARLTALLRDRSLAELRDAAREKAAIETELDRLGPDARLSAEAALPARAFALHEGWRAQQKRRLNIRLAAATAAWMERHADAARATGRNDVAEKLVRAELKAIRRRGREFP